MKKLRKIILRMKKTRDKLLFTLGRPSRHESSASVERDSSRHSVIVSSVLEIMHSPNEQ